METTSLKSTLNQRVEQLRVDTHPEQTASSVFKENFGQFERIGATFTHKINRPLRNTLVGHSKPVNQPEPADKQALLKKIVRRLMSSSKGYLSPGCSIEFYQNRSNSDRDTLHLFTLYPDRWEPNPQVLHWSWLIQYLNHLYTPTMEMYVQDLSGSAPTPYTVPVHAPAPPKNARNTFNYNRHFRDSKELREYCETLIRDGHPQAEVSNYSLKMYEKHNW